MRVFRHNLFELEDIGLNKKIKIYNNMDWNTLKEDGL